MNQEPEREKKAQRKLDLWMALTIIASIIILITSESRELDIWWIFGGIGLTLVTYLIS